MTLPTTFTSMEKKKKYSLPSEERALIITEPEGLCQQWKRQECLSLAALCQCVTTVKVSFLAISSLYVSAL